MSSVIETPTTPTLPLSHEDAARELIAQFRARLFAIDGFGFLPPGKRRKLSPAANVSDRFVESVASTASNNVSLAPSATAPGALSPAQLRDGLSFSNAYLRACDELEVLVRGLRETALAKRAEVGDNALRLYRISQAINRTADPELLVPEVGLMRRTLGRGRGRRPEAVDPETPVTPTPPETPPPTPVTSTAKPT